MAQMCWNSSTNDIAQNKEQIQQTLLIFNIFCYGFIALISLVGIANIFNTLSTSIALRRKEFAMLRSVGDVTQELCQDDPV